MDLLFYLLSVVLTLLHKGVSGVGSDEVSVMEGDSVTLYTGVQKIQQEDIKWYFYDIRIAKINGDLSTSCTDVQCKAGDERFRDRLKLDHQTGSLTIMNITNTHSGLYELKLISSRVSGNIFNVSVHGVSAAERVTRKSVKEGDSVTLDPGVIRKPNDVMTWYYNETLIAEITGDQRKICTDVWCKERFRDRLKLDHQTGSLTIMKITNTHSGEYKLQMIFINRTFSITRVKRFSVSVTAVPGSALSSGSVAGIVFGVILLVSAVVGAAVAMIYYCYHESRGRRQNEGDADDPPADPNAIPLEDMEHPGDADDPRPDPNDNPLEDMALLGDAGDPRPDPNDNPLEDMEHPGDADDPRPDPNDNPLEDIEHPGDADNLRPDPIAIPLEDMEHPGNADNPPAETP